MTTSNLPTIDQLATEIGLNEKQKTAIKEYLLKLLLANFQLMKQEYNEEIDKAMVGLAQPADNEK